MHVPNRCLAMINLMWGGSCLHGLCPSFFALKIKIKVRDTFPTVASGKGSGYPDTIFRQNHAQGSWEARGTPSLQQTTIPFSMELHTLCVGQMFSLVSNTKIQLYTDNEIKLKKKKKGEYILYTDHFISSKQYFPKWSHFQLEKK